MWKPAQVGIWSRYFSKSSGTLVRVVISSFFGEADHGGELQGLAVIMVSSEIPEVLGMSDRVIVMREGRIVAELGGDEMTPETLVRHAAGIRES